MAFMIVGSEKGLFSPGEIELESCSLEAAGCKLSGHYWQSQSRSTHVRGDGAAFKTLDKEEHSENTVKKNLFTDLLTKHSDW